jgi:hypothetical protein
MDKDLVTQTKNAIDFIQKLYFEISYLIKEIEGVLREEKESFVIGKPSGYSVNTRTSTGLEPINVEMWLPKAFAVFFVPEDKVKTYQGQTITKITKDLKVILIYIELQGKDVTNPKIIFAQINNIVSKKPNLDKFEHFLSRFTYNSRKIFSNPPDINFTDSLGSLKGKFDSENLFSINNSEELKKKIIEPVLKLYRKS